MEMYVYMCAWIHLWVFLPLSYWHVTAYFHLSSFSIVPSKQTIPTSHEMEAFARNIMETDERTDNTATILDKCDISKSLKIVKQINGVCIESTQNGPDARLLLRLLVNEDCVEHQLTKTLCIVRQTTVKRGLVAPLNAYPVNGNTGQCDENAVDQVHRLFDAGQQDEDNAENDENDGQCEVDFDWSRKIRSV